MYEDTVKRRAIKYINQEPMSEAALCGRLKINSDKGGRLVTELIHSGSFVRDGRLIKAARGHVEWAIDSQIWDSGLKL